MVSFSDCSGENIKNNDLFEWKRKFTGTEINSSTLGGKGLVKADACIVVKSATGSSGELVEIVISWFSTVSSKDAATESDLADLTATCGSGNNNSHRRQISIETYVGKSS